MGYWPCGCEYWTEHTCQEEVMNEEYSSYEGTALRHDGSMGGNEAEVKDLRDYLNEKYDAPKPEWPKSIVATVQYSLIFNSQEDLDAYLTKIGMGEDYPEDSFQEDYKDAGIEFPVDSVGKLAKIIETDVNHDYTLDEFDFDVYGDIKIKVR